MLEQEDIEGLASGLVLFDSSNAPYLIEWVREGVGGAKRFGLCDQSGDQFEMGFCPRFGIVDSEGDADPRFNANNPYVRVGPVESLPHDGLLKSLLELKEIIEVQFALSIV